MNARTLAHKLARHCAAHGCEIVEGPVKRTMSPEEGATWEFIAYNDAKSVERAPMGTVVVYADLDVRVVEENASNRRALERLLREWKE